MSHSSYLTAKAPCALAVELMRSSIQWSKPPRTTCPWDDLHAVALAEPNPFGQIPYLGVAAAGGGVLHHHELVRLGQLVEQQRKEAADPIRFLLTFRWSSLFSIASGALKRPGSLVHELEVAITRAGWREKPNIRTVGFSGLS